MKYETKFSINETVRVVKDGDYEGTVIGIHIDDKPPELHVSYDVSLPPALRKRGMSYWRYHEDWLEPTEQR